MTEATNQDVFFFSDDPDSRAGVSNSLVLTSGDVMQARVFFLRQILLALSFIFLKNSEVLNFPRKQVDKTVFLNDSSCYWQSICSGEIVHRASVLTGDCVFEATSGGR